MMQVDQLKMSSSIYFSRTPHTAFQPQHFEHRTLTSQQKTASNFAGIKKQLVSKWRIPLSATTQRCMVELDEVMKM
jgi:hypothetical protein